MDELGRLRAGELAGARRLDLGCGLTEFPPEIFDLADSLEVLNLSGNALSALPHDLHRLHRLRVLFCSDNRFTELPEAVGRCDGLEMVGFKANRIARVPATALPPALRWLILTDNQVGMLPAEIGERPRLQKLMLAGNQLQALPDSMAACHALELLRISANRFEALPGWLGSLPRLSWLAFAGNPFDDGPEAMAMDAQPTPAIDWQQLSPGRKLGEGASGVIHQADWRQPDGSLRPVAVKLFKGAVTSDGWPHSEMAACIAAGEYPGLIPVLGRVRNHPDATPGLVLELVDASFGNLAGPPSLQSCTRDVYADDARWTPQTALRMARGLASAVARLHARGILHGDLYGHNILWNRRGDALLGDFGAASFLPRDDDAQSRALQRLEARAFGCLLEELLQRCAPADPAAQASLDEMRSRCLDDNAAARPLFDEIAAALGP
ncbi:leucine-rich repeat-containing protein kinase family protein [Variovorax sp. J22R187]|uniref:leucine-rich repeat-containing protein kinase family protein n=1 Tax=Variovorax saccharolyticus TaxID=3053516 RepID=UPI002577DF8F|nr:MULTISPECIES: leucine-rich repeat-containing protein kinase family protein [unclassified Variovorax]MDM0020454.1 leucine-rich repeat-containing protein kinase family protein [Variovorax sp. J22R187]MDM0026005.1 leucine-rich repeat-containing protein kinase family protein [Variovorax sp. J31P216]